MEIQFINPVLHSVKQVLSQSTRDKVQIIKAGKPQLRTAHEPSQSAVSGIMSMQGPDAHASVALSFSKEAILEIASYMLPEVGDSIDHIITDLAGELTNMVIGDAKRQLEAKGLQFELSLPVLVIGPEHIVAHRPQAPIIRVPFQLQHGAFYVEAVYEKL